MVCKFDKRDSRSFMIFVNTTRMYLILIPKYVSSDEDKIPMETIKNFAYVISINIF